MRIQSFDPTHLPQLTLLVNLHLGAVMPGWGLTEPFLARLLEHDDYEPITDPWVAERATLCAIDHGRVVAAAHLLRYGDGPEVGDSFRDIGEIGWMLALPERDNAAAAILAHAHDQLTAWKVTWEAGWGAGLSIGPLAGVPDAWPHIAAALTAAGYRPDPSQHGEALYGGVVDDGQAAPTPPLPGLTVGRTVGTYETRFSALLDGQEIGWCDVQADLSQSGLLPSLREWAWLGDLWISERWRNQGVGRWLVEHAIIWFRLAGCNRVVLSVDAGSDEAGAGRFYRRFGWDVLTRLTRTWQRVDGDR